MDPNRAPEIACITTTSDCTRAYNDYHWMIETKFFQEYIQAKPQHYSMGLVLDIHGQTHAENWIELGYILSKDELNKQVLDFGKMKSSVDNLISHGRHTMEDIIRGYYKFKFFKLIFNIDRFFLF